LIIEHINLIIEIDEFKLYILTFTGRKILKYFYNTICTLWGLDNITIMWQKGQYMHKRYVER